MNKLIFLISILFFLEPSHAQTYQIKRNKFLEYLYYSKANFDDINSNHDRKLDILRIPLNNIHQRHDRQIFIKSKDALYLIFEGTGLVFKASIDSKHKIWFTRIDSTEFSGYNFNAINFSYKDTLFSFGGYGYWRNNGHLRYFINNEWLLMPLNQEIPLMNHIYFYDREKEKIFSIVYSSENQAEKKKENFEPSFQVNLTDLNSKNNEIIGNLNPIFKSIYRESYPLWMSTKLNGSVIAYNQNAYLINFEKNRIYKSISNKIMDKLTSNIRYNTGYIFQSNDSVYYVRNDIPDSLFHFIVSEEDFEKNGSPLFIPVQKNYTQTYSIPKLITLAIIAIIIIYTLKIKSGNNLQLDNAVSKDNFSDNEIHLSNFNNFEKEIITTIINDKPVTVDSLNHILGLSKKSLEIQKKSRNDVIHRINHKFKILCEVETDLIERIRSEEDKRYFKYHITKANEQIYLNHIKNPDSKRK